MICGVHAFIGAALGKALKNKSRAFWSGVISHFFLDLTPHRDFSIPTEAVLVLTSLALIGSSQGWNSSAFWGAVGAVAPDIENAISQIYGSGRSLFPSHDDRLHGPKVKEIASQAGILLICLGILYGAGIKPQAAKQPAK